MRDSPLFSEKISFGVRSKPYSRILYTSDKNAILYGRHILEGGDQKQEENALCESTEIYCTHLPIFTVTRLAFIYLFRSRVFIRCTRRKSFQGKIWIYILRALYVTTDARTRRRRRRGEGFRRASALNVHERCVENDSGAIKPRLKIM